MAQKKNRKQPPAAPARAAAPAPAVPLAAPPHSDALVIAALAVLCLAVFGQVATFPFVNFDDSLFVFENPAVKAGLAPSSIQWALTSFRIGYYPLTWLSHMLDAQIWGLNPSGHHITAVLLHFASSVVLYLAFRRMTANVWPSALVAALFAVHPMHVESVAWVSERKDTLSTLFGIVALLAYTRPPSIRRHIGVGAALAASLLSKQMLVTLPFVLLLLDWWPLQRFEPRFRNAGRLVAEKIPLFAIAAAASAIAIIGQRNLNAIQASSAVPLGDRIANALVAYAAYIGKLFWPANMAPMYPLTPLPFASAFGAFGLIAAITAAAILLRKPAPYLLVGWLWFLGTLVPVIGIVQIGSQSMADRYTYFPYIGLFIAIAFGAADLLSNRVFAIGSAVVVVLFAAVAFGQTRYWRNTDVLFTHTVAVTGPNPLAEYTLGQTLELTDPDRSITHLRRAIDLAERAYGGRGAAASSPVYAQCHVGIGTALIVKAQKATDPVEKTHLLDGASAELQTALRLNPSAAVAKRNLALVESIRPKTVPAAPPAVEAEIDSFIDAGFAYMQKNDHSKALVEFGKAVAVAPESVEARVYLAIGLARAGRNAEAATELRRAKTIDPVRANRYVTGILRKPQSDANLDLLLLQLER